MVLKSGKSVLRSSLFQDTDYFQQSQALEATYGVTFILENGAFPTIAKIGPPFTAFMGYPNNTSPDTPAPTQGVGSFFLTDNPGFSGMSPPALIITFASPVRASSGVILDIDFTEKWTIQARNASGNILETIILNAGDLNTGDGIATPWSFNRSDFDIYSISFKGERKDAEFGLAFDNFSFVPVPIPSTLILFITGIAALIGFHRQRLNL